MLFGKIILSSFIPVSIWICSSDLLASSDLLPRFIGNAIKSVLAFDGRVALVREFWIKPDDEYMSTGGDDFFFLVRLLLRRFKILEKFSDTSDTNFIARVFENERRLFAGDSDWEFSKESTRGEKACWFCWCTGGDIWIGGISSLNFLVDAMFSEGTIMFSCVCIGSSGLVMLNFCFPFSGAPFEHPTSLTS